jgi:uncharacterized heparinase superfamily protein
LFADSVRAELAEARRLAAHCFTLFGHTVDYGERIAWFRDPLSGRNWDFGFSPDIPYRGPERLGDIKFPWELSKHQYFFTLGKAAWLTDDSSLSVEIIRQIDNWIEDNPYCRGIHWIDALQVGTRAVSWITAYPFYADLCDSLFKRRLTRSLAQHLLFVEKHLSVGRFANNHLIGDAAALVVGGLFLECKYSRRWLEKGLVLLEEEISRQVTVDGVHAERSPAYHRFCLDHYYLVQAILAVNGRSLPEPILRGMERMTEFLMDILFPDGSAPAFGDGDDARGLWFHADCPGDYRSLLALGAVVFGRGDFKKTAGDVTEEVLWLMGTQGVNRFLEIPECNPSHTSTAYPEGGYYVMRGGWSVSHPVLVFDCGPLGHGSAGHGHADALSLQLDAGGYPFLVDSGTYSYNLDYAWRDAFRSTRAHNTVVVDGLDQSVPGDRMSWRTMAEAHCHRWVTTKWFDLADGKHNGYCRLPDPVTHRRVVVFSKPDTWWVWDQLDGKGHHDIEVLLHLMPDCSVELGERKESLVLRSPDGIGLHTWMLDRSPATGFPEILVGSDEERSAWFSPGYGVRIPARALSIRRAIIGKGTVITCFSTADDVTPTLMKQDGVIGVCLQRKGEFAEKLLYRLESDQWLEADGIRFDGDLLYSREEAGKYPVLWVGGFRELSVAALIDVHSPVPIDSLILEKGQCHITVAAGDAAYLQFTTQKGVQFVINGQPAPTGETKNHSSLVTS